jgi:type II secretory pathway predicted ATPase ExeA
LKENPFHVSPDPRFLFAGPAYETALAELMFGIEAHRGLLVLTGEAGTGKTTLMRHFLQWLDVRRFSSAYVFHAHLDPRDLYEFILRDFGIPLESARKSDLLVSLHHWLLLRQAEGDSPVIVIDEAQALSLRTLNELNSMLNLENPRGKLLQIVLAGQPELDEKFRRPESRALRQRIMVRCRLPLLTLDETSEYIDSRLRGAGSPLAASAKMFPLETVETIYSFARGIPRVVNLLCEHGLVGAFADHQMTVSPQNIRRAAAEFDLAGAPFSPDQPHLVLRESPASSELAPIQLEEAPAISQQLKSVAEPVADSTLLESPEPAAEIAACTPLVEAPATPHPEAVGVPVLLEQAAESLEISAPAALEAAFVPPESKVQEVVVEPSSTLVLGANPKTAEVAVARDAGPVRATLQAAVAPPHRTYAWRKHREVSTFQRSFRRYWREVASSFVRDWRQFFRSVVPQTATIPALPSLRTDSIRHKIMEPIRDWLAKPFNLRAAPRPKSHTDSSDENNRRN